MEQDGSEAKNVPAAESKGAVHQLKSTFISSTSYNVICFGFAGFHFDTEDGDRVIPGFLDSIIGIQGGETRSFPLVFPDTWKQEDLRGLPCQFTVCFLLLQILIQDLLRYLYSV